MPIKWMKRGRYHSASSERNECAHQFTEKGTQGLDVVGSDDRMEGGERTGEHLEAEVEVEAETPRPNIQRRNSTIRSRISRECCAILCPCALICRAICECDMELLWKLCSSLFVLKALWSSILVLFMCNLFKVHRITPNFSDDMLAATTNNVESYLFGLWTYTEKIEMTDHSFIHEVENELKEIESCHFHMNRVDLDAPEMLFVNDWVFTFVRVIASIVVGVGFISMILVWLNAANYCRGRMDSLIPMALLSCAILESFVFFILGSSVCRDPHVQEQRYCSLQEGSGLIFASIFAWLISFIGKLMVNRHSTAATAAGGASAIVSSDPSSSDELTPPPSHSDLYLHEVQEVKSADHTFDESFDDSVEDDKSTSEFVIS